MARLRYNGLTATLGADLLTADTTITFSSPLTSAAGAVPTIGSGDYIPLAVLDASGGVLEIIHLTAYTSGATTGTVTRAEESTTAADQPTGSTVVNGVTVADIDEALAGGGGGGGSTVSDRRWTVGSSETSVDEFDDDTLDAAWVRVDGTGAVAGNLTWGEAAGTLAATHGGGDDAGVTHALLRPIGTALSAGDGFVTCLRIHGQAGANYSMGGLILADGATHGAGAQVAAAAAYESGSASNVGVVQYGWANFTSVPSTGTIVNRWTAVGTPLYLRLLMTAANTWRVDTSANGAHWFTAGHGARTVTPTHVGFLSTSWGTASKHVAAYEFLRRVSGVS